MMSVHSFILRFKRKYKNILLKIMELAVLAVCIIAAGKVLEYFLLAEDGYTRMLMEDFYQTETNIDNLFLGSSHVHYNIKPDILDSATGEESFSLATGLQPMNTSYYLLKEADKRNKISHVYLEISCGLTLGDYGNFKTYEQLPNSWRVLDYVKPSINKLQWMLDISEPQYYYLSFIPARRYYKELLDGNYIAQQLKNRAENAEAKQARWGERYVHKGYRETEEVIGGMYSLNQKTVLIEENSVSDDTVKYLKKIIDYCKSRKIEITLFTSPLTESDMHKIIHYDIWGKEIRELAESYGINYFDFNLCKEEYLYLYDKQYWRDSNHLNTWGAEIYSRVLGEVFEAEKKGEADPYQYFYESYEQKMDHMDKMVFGLTIDEVWWAEKEKYLEAAKVKGESDNYRVFLIASVDNYEGSDMEFCFYLTDREGQTKQTLQSWNDSGICIVKANDDSDVLHIGVRRKGGAWDNKSQKWYELALMK